MLRKKAFMVEALIRVIVAVLLIWGAIAIGKKIGEAYFGGSLEKTEFDKLVKTLNEMEVGEGPLVYDIVLDNKNAIFGIGESGQFNCYMCGEPGTPFGGSFHYVIEKKGYCSEGNSCICLCRGVKAELIPGRKIKQQVSTSSGLQEYEFPVSEIKCKKSFCKSLDVGIADISLNPIFKEWYLMLGQSANAELVAKENHKWEGGFVYVNGAEFRYVLQNEGKKRQQVYLEKINKNGNTVVAVCPFFGCLSKSP